MHLDKKRLTAVKISKEKVKKIGVRSISDIITNTPELSFKEKVDYIRHKYTYYNGNYEYFHTAKGKPNIRKYELNNLIVQILKKDKDPSELKNINLQILQWRKEKNIQLTKEQTEFLESFSSLENPKLCEELPAWKQKIASNLHNNPYISTIEEFLLSEANNLSNDDLENIPYKKLRDLAVEWKLGTLINASEEYKARMTQSIQAKIKKQEKKEEKYIKNKMKQYAMDLGYIKEEDKNAETI